jgi:hypothetical protein
MKLKNLYVFLGNSIEGNELSKNKSEGDAFYLFDQDLKDGMNSLPSKENMNFFDIAAADSIQELISELMPVENIVICPLLYNFSTVDGKLALDNILQKIFIFVKMMYLPTMRHRQSKVWFLDTSPLFLVKDPCSQSADVSQLHSFSAGLKVISKVTAMELAKKTINVNVITVNEKNYFPKLESFLLWVIQENKLYLTAQELSI